MNKLRLQLEELAVESFETTTLARRSGTVLGQQCTCDTDCTCPGCPTCDYTCPETCDDGTCGGGTCEGTCIPDGCPPSAYDTCPAICPQ